MHHDQEKKLRAKLVKLAEGSGSIKETIDGLTAGAWDSLLWSADNYLQDDAGSAGNWKDAEKQWSTVARKSQELIASLEALGTLAFAIRLDTAVQVPALWSSVQTYLDSGDPEDLCELRDFAELAKQNCVVQKGARNGSHRENETGKRAFLLSRLHWILQCPARPWAHARAIAGVIHDWATGSALDDADWKRAEKMARPGMGKEGVQTPCF